MRITAILAGLAPQTLRAIDIYRITGPYTAIRAKTKHHADWLSEKTLSQMAGKQLEGILSSDLIVLQRLVHTDSKAVDKAMQLLKSRGAKIVYECDDDLTGHYRKDPSGGTCLPYMPYVDAFSASTQVLADRMHELTGAPAYVLPNYLPLNWFETSSRYDLSAGRCARQRQYPGTLNIMLAGTPTHDEDWRVIVDLIPGILRDYPGVQVLFAGHKPAYVPDHERVGFLPPQAYTGYPSMLFEADIVCAGLAPQDPFNWAKSPCKALEAWAALRPLEDGKQGGAAVIATDTVVYNQTVKDGDNGLLVEHTPEAWDRALRTLIEQDTLRRSLQRRGLNTVRRYSIANHYREWLSVYSHILRV